MATTDFSSSGGQITVTVESNDPINYSPSGSTYGFLPNFPNRLQVLFVSAGITVSYIVELADLRVSGSGSAPISEAAALTALNAVWAAAQGGGATQLFEYTALVAINAAGSNITENEIINNLTINVVARLSAGIYYFSLPENSRPLLPIITDISAQTSQEAFCLTTSNNDLFCRVYLYKDSDYTNRVYMATKDANGILQDDLLSQNLISFKSL